MLLSSQKRNRGVHLVHHLDLGRTPPRPPFRPSNQHTRRSRQPPPTGNHRWSHYQSYWSLHEFDWRTIHYRDVGSQSNAKCGWVWGWRNWGHCIADVAAFGCARGAGEYKCVVESLCEFGMSALVDKDCGFFGPTFAGRGCMIGRERREKMVF